MLSLQYLSIHSTSSHHYSLSHNTLHRFAVLNRNGISYSRRGRIGLPSCSLRVEELSDTRTALRIEEDETEDQEEEGSRLSSRDKGDAGEVEEEEEEEEEKGISKIRVSRQKYIPVSKAELLDAIMIKLFGSRESDFASQFLLLSSCLDSILHAEHKSVLEEMRVDYTLTHSIDNDDDTALERLSRNGQESETESDSELEADVLGINGLGRLGDFGDEIRLNASSYFDYGMELGKLLRPSVTNNRRNSNAKSRLAVDTRFQRSFMQLLDNAQFQELSARDLVLTSALNSDYLLTLPIYVDWKKASESNAIIFRRGYATERQKGLLLVEKLDYLQSRLLKKLFSLLSKPLGAVGKLIKQGIQNLCETQEGQEWAKAVTNWLEELYLFQRSYFNTEQDSSSSPDMDILPERDLPIWLAAQRAVSRYEGFLSPVGPRGRLLRRLLVWIGFSPPLQEISFEPDSEFNASEPHLRPTMLSRISLSDIWRPATRKYCGNDIWKMIKTSISILLSQSVLQEPAFGELILLYSEEKNRSNTIEKSKFPPLQLKIYERILIPDLPVVFPHKKLSFRIIDTVRLDIATILGLLAFIINYKFENILSSPSAIFLDVIAITALIIYVTRVALGYKQTWDRYQLLVNKTLYEKTLASGFGSVHFLLDASEQQQYKEAILTYAIFLATQNGQVHCQRRVGDECERFLYDVFKVKVEMPIDKAMNTLVRLGLVTETSINGRVKLQAVSCGEAHEALKKRWYDLLGQQQK